MDAKKLTIFIMLVTLIILALSQSPQLIAASMGQHTFESGRTVDCVKCHKYDAYDDMNSSQQLVLEAHKRAASNTNYTTYLEVGGISYDPINGVINTNVDSDDSGTNDIWIWDGSSWVYNNTAKLNDLDMDGNGIEGSEICKLCHNLELMGIHSIVTSVHTVGTRYCDDDRCHGNKNNQYNDYRLFQDGNRNLTLIGYIISNASVHGNVYLAGASNDANKPMLHPYGIMPGNVISSNPNNISQSPYVCIGCHTFVNVTMAVNETPLFNHSSPYKKSRYT